jgi:hypothetical protein
MNLWETILAEHSKAQTNKIVNWIGSDLLNHTSKPLPAIPGDQAGTENNH